MKKVDEKSRCRFPKNPYDVNFSGSRSRWKKAMPDPEVDAGMPVFIQLYVIPL